MIDRVPLWAGSTGGRAHHVFQRKKWLTQTVHGTYSSSGLLALKKWLVGLGLELGLHRRVEYIPNSYTTSILVISSVGQPFGKSEKKVVSYKYQGYTPRYWAGSTYRTRQAVFVRTSTAFVSGTCIRRTILQSFWRRTRP